MRLGTARERVPAEVADAAGLERGERILAFGRDGGTWLLGTRRALVILAPDGVATRLGWEQVQAADWDRDEERLRVSEVGEFGRPRAEFAFALENPQRLLQLIRERVSASVVLQRGYPVEGKKGFKVIGRRSPEGGPIAWMHEYDAGIDPDDPLVATAAADALERARADVGER